MYGFISQRCKRDEAKENSFLSSDKYTEQEKELCHLPDGTKHGEFHSFDESSDHQQKSILIVLHRA